MATAKAPGKPPPAAPRAYRSRPIGELLPGITRPAFRTRAPAAAQVLADWAAIAGPGLAAAATPRRLVGGTLTLACSGPMALELQHLSGQVIERVNAALGKLVVERLRFVQGVAPVAPPPPRRPALAPVAVPGLPPGPLRDALAALGAAVGGAGPEGAGPGGANPGSAGPTSAGGRSRLTRRPAREP